MIELKQTETFRKWFAKLQDERAVTAITSRLDRLAFGHAGDADPGGKGVSELRIHYGPGYRVYFQRRVVAIKDHKHATSRLRTASPINGANDHDREIDRL